MVGTRRSSEEIEAKTLGYLAEICQRGNNTRDRCLPALLFLSGRRIGELLELKRKDFEINEKLIRFTTFNEKTYRTSPSGTYRLESLRETNEGYEIIYYQQIEPTFSLKSETGKVLGDFVVEHLENLGEEDYVFSHLSDQRKHIKRQMAWRIIVGLEPRVWPHWFRHQRFTQITNIFKSDPLVTHRFTFHKRFESTLQYYHVAEKKEQLERI